MVGRIQPVLDRTLLTIAEFIVKGRRLGRVYGGYHGSRIRTQRKSCTWFDG